MPVLEYGTRMDIDPVRRIASKSEDSQELREQLTRHLEVLGKCLETCKRFAARRASGGRSPLMIDSKQLDPLSFAQTKLGIFCHIQLNVTGPPLGCDVGEKGLDRSAKSRYTGYNEKP